MEVMFSIFYYSLFQKFLGDFIHLNHMIGNSMSNWVIRKFLIFFNIYYSTIEIYYLSI